MLRSCCHQRLGFATRPPFASVSTRAASSRWIGLLNAGIESSIWQVVLWVALAIFFYAKAFWEDRLLAEKHGVAWFDYADHVGGFIPRFWGSR